MEETAATDCNKVKGGAIIKEIKRKQITATDKEIVMSKIVCYFLFLEA